MVVWHVTTYRKLQKYLKSGQINPPVRAWESIKDAEKFSLSTKRRVILRLKFSNKALRLTGHKGRAKVINEPYYIKKEDL